jgi:hypothetical protein
MMQSWGPYLGRRALKLAIDCNLFTDCHKQGKAAACQECEAASVGQSKGQLLPTTCKTPSPGTIRTLPNYPDDVN